MTKPMTRYRLNSTLEEMVADPGGEYVRYEDVVAVEPSGGPADLVDALQDKVHEDAGPFRAGRSVRAEPGCDRQEDRAYYNGARQAAAMAHQSLRAMDEWINGGCGGRGPVVNRTAEPR